MARTIIGKARKPAVICGHNWWSTSYGMPRKFIPKDKATQEKDLKNSLLSTIKFSLEEHEIEEDLKAIKESMSLIPSAFSTVPATEEIPCTVTSQSAAPESVTQETAMVMKLRRSKKPVPSSGEKIQLKETKSISLEPSAFSTESETVKIPCTVTSQSAAPESVAQETAMVMKLRSRSKKPVPSSGEKIQLKKTKSEKDLLEKIMCQT